MRIAEIRCVHERAGPARFSGRFERIKPFRLHMMKTQLLTALLGGIVSLLAIRATAQEAHPDAADHATAPAHGKASADDSRIATGEAAHDSSHATADPTAGPVPPAKSPQWAGVVLILILTIFVMAAVIGPLARAHAPPAEMPPTHSHDEPPGASHHHGESGTLNPEPGHGRH